MPLRRLSLLIAALAPVLQAQQAPQYDLLLKGGHVIDAKNHLSAVRDVAIKDGKIAAVAANIRGCASPESRKASGLYVTPGLVDIHVHFYAGTGERGSYAGDCSLYPDGFTLRNGVTTVADAGSSGWRNFEDFQGPGDQPFEDADVLAFLNIVGQRDARRQVRTGPQGHGRQADRGDGAEA